MGSSATCLAQGGSHFFSGGELLGATFLRVAFWSILGQRFGHDSAFGKRSGGISGISLHRILLRIFLDGSGIRIEEWHGNLLVPSWENGCQVGKVGGWSKKIEK